MQQNIEQWLTNPKAGIVAATGTLASSAASFLNIISPHIATIASASGIVLTWIMIYMHIKKMRREDEEHKLKMSKIQLEVDRLKVQ